MDIKGRNTLYKELYKVVDERLCIRKSPYLCHCLEHLGYDKDLINDLDELVQQRELFDGDGEPWWPWPSIKGNRIIRMEVLTKAIQMTEE